MLKDTSKKRLTAALKKTIECVALKKANANCLGLMYEPKKPEKLIKQK